jgi:predicted transcriptional regulator
MTTAMTLPPKFTGRLEKLALEAGSTPEKMLDYVMRDGFEYTEHFVSAVKKGIADADGGQVVSHEEVMIRLQAIIKKHAKNKKAA